MAFEVTYQGGRFDYRTLDMLHEVERLLPFDIFVSQGGYNVGGVSASAGTHDRAAVDISASILTPSERAQLDYAGRHVGFAGWVRTPAQGFPWHWHGVPVNGDLSIPARAQVVAYYGGKNGLAGGGPDDGPRDFVGVTWETYSRGAYRPPIDIDPTGGEDMQADERAALFDIKNRLENVEKQGQYPGGGGTPWSQAIANQMAANHKVLAAELAAIRNQLTNVERQGQTGAGYDYLPAIVNQLNSALAKLDDLAKRVG